MIDYANASRRQRKTCVHVHLHSKMKVFFFQLQNIESHTVYDPGELYLTFTTSVERWFKVSQRRFNVLMLKYNNFKIVL